MMTMKKMSYVVLCAGLLLGLFPIGLGVQTVKS